MKRIDGLSIILVLLSIVILYSVWQSVELKNLKTKVSKERIELIRLLGTEVENIRQEQLNTITLLDSALTLRIDSLKKAQTKLINKYEKINIEYGSILIERPEF